MDTLETPVKVNATDETPLAYAVAVRIRRRVAAGYWNMRRSLYLSMSQIARLASKRYHRAAHVRQPGMTVLLTCSFHWRRWRLLPLNWCMKMCAQAMMR